MFLLAIGCVGLSKSVYDRYVIERDMSARRLEAEAELQKLQTRKDSLQEKIDYLRDDRGIEAEIRKHFDVVREGEQVVVLLDNTRPTPTTTVTSTIPAEDKPSFWSLLVSWF